MCGKADDSITAGEEISNPLRNGWTHRSGGLEFVTHTKKIFHITVCHSILDGKVSFVMYQNLHKLFYVPHFFTRPMDTKKSSRVDEFHGLCLFI
jgi:hypothetical protein